MALQTDKRKLSRLFVRGSRTSVPSPLSLVGGPPVMPRAGTTIPLLCIGLLLAVACGAQQQELDDSEMSSFVFRGLGISGEPSLHANCSNGGYAGFRLFEYVAMSPVAIVRFELIKGDPTVTKRIFKDTRNRDSEIKEVHAAQWQGLIDVFEVSGFWNADAADSAWSPDGLKWLIEACYRGTFHSLMLYPERDYRMHEVVSYMTSVVN